MSLKGQERTSNTNRDTRHTTSSALLPRLRNFNWTPVLLFVAVVVVTGLLSPDFLRVQNLLNVGQQASIIGVIAVGMTLVILTAGIDLSVGSTLALAAVSSAMMIQAGLPIALVILFTLLVGAVVGLANGIGVAILGLQPFIMTLATLALVRGVALRIANGSPQAIQTDNWVFNFFGNGEIGPVPGPLIVFIVVAVGGWFLLRYLPFGRYVYAVGVSKEAARLSGVRTKRVLLGVYVISGVCASVAGLMTASRLSVGEPIAGNLAELDTIAAVVIGGTSLAGGVGGMVGTVVGAFLLGVLANVLNLVGVSPFDQQIVKGLVIIAAVLLMSTSISRRFKGKRSNAGPENAGHDGTEKIDPSRRKE